MAFLLFFFLRQQNNRNYELSHVTSTGILCPHGLELGPTILFLLWGEKATCYLCDFPRPSARLAALWLRA